MPITDMIDHYQDRSHAKSTNPRLRRFWASRARRRRYTVLLAATVPAGALLLGALPFYSGTLVAAAVLLPLALLVMATLAVVNTQLGLATYASSGHRNLDERQRVELDRARQIGHHCTTALLGVAFAAIAFGTTFSPESVAFPGEMVTPLLWLILLTHLAVPICYLAWTQPDDADDDAQE